MTTQLATAHQENPSFDTNTSITFYRWLDEHKRGLTKGKKTTKGSNKAAAKATRYGWSRLKVDSQLEDLGIFTISRFSRG